MKQVYPLWLHTKLNMMDSLWNAQEMANKYRLKQNPKCYHKFQNHIVECWLHIKPYTAYIKDLDQEIIEELDQYTLGIPSKERNKTTQTKWITFFNFIQNKYQELGITDVAKKEAEIDPAKAVLEGLFE